MQLLNPKEKEKEKDQEKDRERQKAVELSQEITELTKSFNRTKEELEKQQNNLLARHTTFSEEIFKKRDDLEENIRKLEIKRDTAMKPLYEKERILDRKKEHLDTQEEDLNTREQDIRTREYEVSELKKICTKALNIIEFKEQESRNREKRIIQREADFTKFKERQDGVLKQNKAKLRQFFEEEQRKLRK